VSYDFRAAEGKWQARWAAEPPVPGAGQGRPKFYNLVEFPYPSAEGLHVGHVYTYCGADVLGRYKAMNGWRVFQPMGWDAFGIHTENYALKIGESPRTVTDRATANYRKQLSRLGVSWNWEAELRTDDPRYYRWTQWIFVKLHEAGLTARKESPVIWCPSCRTVLAFEQTEGDQCERCGSVVTTRVMRQWYLRITAYADELLDSLDGLDWPDLSKQLQRDWIGRSRGAEVKFAFAGPAASRAAGPLTAFTTRLDTLAGVTFVAVAPEHPVVGALASVSANGDEIRSYAARVSQRVGTARLAHIGQEAAAVRTGAQVINPLTGEPVPVIVADYVIADYGSGVVMGVPAHDVRDARTAQALGLPARVAVRPDPAGPALGGPEPGEPAGGGPGETFAGDGVLAGPGAFGGMRSGEARVALAAWLAEHGAGGAASQYRLHDWLVSRQRYWGSPIPIIYCDGCGTVPVPVADLPVELPGIGDSRPAGTGQSPLAMIDDFVNVACPACGGPGRRETDILDTFVESSWYYLRYPSTGRDDVPWDEQLTAGMLPVDMYAGGREHTTRHHLYARFISHALHDLGLIGFREPFTKLRLHGLIVSAGAKMSKSRGNVVNPDEYLDRVGADALRAYLLFCGPWEEGGEFDDRALAGLPRFNGRLWELVSWPPPGGSGLAGLAPLHRAVRDVGAGIEALKFNTVIAELMSLSSWMRSVYPSMTPAQWAQACRTLVLLLAPVEPYLAEELWSVLSAAYSVHQQDWPGYDPAALETDTVTVPVQVNGKVRHTIELAPAASEQAACQAACADPVVRAALAGRSPRRVVYVPGRVINLVV
jgi:leucyl-tRNA synthetase